MAKTTSKDWRSKPRKDPRIKKTEMVVVRISKAEKLAIEEQAIAAGMKFSEYVLFRLTNRG